MNYCVYFHINKITGDVFYVGIGNKKRPYSSISRSKFWENVVEKYGYDVKIIHKELSFEEACLFEIKYINHYGRLDIKTGTLVNLTNGGECCDGYKHTEETKDIIRKYWSNYRGFDIKSEDMAEYLKEYNKKYMKEYRKNDPVKRKYQKYARDKYNNMNEEEMKELSKKKKEYRDNLSEEQKEKNREYQRLYKLNMTEEQKEKQRKKNRENMRKKRK